MSLSINNSYAPNTDEAAQMDAWNAMSDEERGEYIFQTKQACDIQDYVENAALTDYINSNDVQRLSSGGIQVGGQLRSDALVTIGGLEMTVQQAIDAGVYSSEAIGQQVSEMGERVDDQASLLAGVHPSEITVNKWGQVLTQDTDGSIWMYDEALNEWFEAEVDQ